MPNDYLSAANRYRPAQVRVLFIAESPPAFISESKKSYFCFEKNPGGDLLFCTIVEAVLNVRYRKRGAEPKARLLQNFQANGNWLMDAVEYPINKVGGKKTSDGIRRDHIERAKSNLLSRIAALRAKNGGRNFTIVLIKNLVYECLAQSLRQSGYHVPQIGPIGFPRYHGDPATINGIRRSLGDGNAG